MFSLGTPTSVLHALTTDCPVRAVTMQLAQSLKSEGFTFIAIHPGASRLCQNSQ